MSFLARKRIRTGQQGALHGVSLGNHRQTRMASVVTRESPGKKKTWSESLNLIINSE